MARPQVTGTQSHLSAWQGSWSFYDERKGDGEHMLRSLGGL